MKLWHLKRPSGLWVVERTVRPEEAEQWLAIFRRHHPDEVFVVSVNRPPYPKLWPNTERYVTEGYSGEKKALPELKVYINAPGDLRAARKTITRALRSVLGRRYSLDYWGGDDPFISVFDLEPATVERISEAIRRACVEDGWTRCPAEMYYER